MGREKGVTRGERTHPGGWGDTTPGTSPHLLAQVEAEPQHQEDEAQHGVPNPCQHLAVGSSGGISVGFHGLGFGVPPSPFHHFPTLSHP